MITSSSDDWQATDVSGSVTVPSASTETTLTGTATVFPVRTAVFRISASWKTKHTTVMSLRGRRLPGSLHITRVARPLTQLPGATCRHPDLCREAWGCS